MSASICILCFQLLLKATDRNLVDGKCKVKDELDDLPFVVHRSSSYICKKCLALIKKRKNLKENLCKADEQLTLLYHQKCGEHGFTMKRRETGSGVTRKLRFSNSPNDKEVVPSGIHVEHDEIHQELILQHLPENPYCLRYFFFCLPHLFITYMFKLLN